jgi:hypothetical protein
MKTVNFRHDSICRVCGSAEVEVVWNLKPSPLGDDFRPTVSPHELVPMDLAICLRCSYLHLATIVNPADSYSEYLYQSDTTVGLRDHYKIYASEICARYHLAPGAVVLDIGSNDGLMLSAFKELGLGVIGVEPAPSPARYANDRGITTINRYFDHEARNIILRRYGFPKLVTANYVFANIDALPEFLALVKSVLAEDGIFVIETGYHPEQFKNFMFDYIYHEHYSYFSVKVLQDLLGRHGFKLLSASQSSAKGGSIRIEAQHETGVRLSDDSVEKLLVDESERGISRREVYDSFRVQIERKGNEVCEIVRREREQGRAVIGFGASHSTTTLLHQFGLGDQLKYLVDDNPLKQGLYSPGFNLPVYPVSALERESNFSIVILAWQHQQSIMSRHRRALSAAERRIIPLPNLVVD